MANGRRSRLTYPREGPPVLSARIQELYGIEGRFSLGRGRVPVKILSLIHISGALRVDVRGSLIDLRLVKPPFVELRKPS